ncbi:MAG: hypothetical protein HY235_28330 [Acidobacteria bacterium]|nr:hypothetical protein [Acidobacteriota bacterium]
MIGIREWMRDLLVSRGALVESEEGDGIRALLPADVAAELGAGEWISLDFGTRPGADDAFEWMERMQRLLPAHVIVAGAQLRSLGPAPQVDVASMLSSEFAIQNGVYRFVEEFATTANYLFFLFQYTVVSDERSMGFVTVCLNADAQSMAPLPENFLRMVRSQLQEAEPSASPDTMAALYPAAAKEAQREIRKHLTRIQENAGRRLARDSERVESYYRGLLSQIEKRIAKRTNDPEAAAKERSRAAATEADCQAKLEDLRRKYSLHVQAGLASVLAVRAPVRQISLRLMRKKQERQRMLHWNPALRTLEPVLCESCSAPAHPLYLCERVHCLCRECWAPCAACGRFFCRACQQRCSCGGKAS